MTSVAKTARDKIGRLHLGRHSQGEDLSFTITGFDQKLSHTPAQSLDSHRLQSLG